MPRLGGDPTFMCVRCLVISTLSSIPPVILGWNRSFYRLCMLLREVTPSFSDTKSGAYINVNELMKKFDSLIFFSSRQRKLLQRKYLKDFTSKGEEKPRISYLKVDKAVIKLLSSPLKTFSVIGYAPGQGRVIGIVCVGLFPMVVSFYLTSPSCAYWWLIKFKDPWINDCSVGNDVSMIKILFC